MKTVCPKCKSFRSPDKPCKRCGDPAPEMVRCDRADECQVTNCYHAKTHWPHSACISKGCAYYQNPNARCIPVLTTETAVVPETPEPPPAPDSPAECAECAKLRQQIAEARAEAEKSNSVHLRALNECDRLGRELAECKGDLMDAERRWKSAEHDAVGAKELMETARAELSRERAIVDALLRRKDV